MPSMVTLFILIGLLLMTVMGAIGMWIAGEKGQSTSKGFLFGFFIPIIGLIIMGSIKSSDEELTKEMFERKLISKEDFEKTMEIAIKK